MNIAIFSIKRPIFITSIVFLIMALGAIAYTRLGVDMYPDVTEPGLVIYTTYEGAAPEEIESLVTKPIEDEMSSLSGVKRITSESHEGLSLTIVEFNMEADIKYEVQQTTQILAKVKSKLPEDADDPQIQVFTAADMPILTLAVMSDLPPAQMYDLVNDDMKPRLEQVDDVAKIELLGGERRGDSDRTRPE